MDFSIVICIYNPDERILRRCLAAVHGLNRDGIETETLLVDNNSHVPVKRLACVREYREKIRGLSTLLVMEPGVQQARIAAIGVARGKHIVFIDYDNEPISDYLQQLQQLHVRYPLVAAWGPGRVRVDFIDGVDSRIETYARIAFQERQETAPAFATRHEWQDCYPFGTGLCTDTIRLREYAELAKQGRFTLPGRKGNSLSSGEDTQMVLFCISKGYAAGVSPDLQLTHMIPAGKANKTYLQRLAYGTSVCYATCLIQVFPEKRHQLEHEIMGRAAFARRSIVKWIKAKMSRDPRALFELARWLGDQAGVYQALNRQIPVTVSMITASLGLGVEQTKPGKV